MEGNNAIKNNFIFKHIDTINYTGFTLEKKKSLWPNIQSFTQMNA